MTSPLTHGMTWRTRASRACPKARTDPTSPMTSAEKFRKLGRMKACRLLAVAALATSTIAFGGLIACGSSSSSNGDDSSNSDASLSDARSDGTVVVIPPPNGGGSTDGGGGSTDGGGDADAAASPPATACNPDEKLDMSQIFVSTAGTATTGCSETLPCASIQAGIAAAAAQGKTTVYVDQGVYPEQLTLSAGIAIRGARSRTDGWAPICGDARLTATKVHPPTGVDRAVIAQDLGGAASLEALDVQYATVAQPGQSMYGVFATGATTTLSLVDVTMVVPAGGAGTNGAAGTAGVAGGASDCGHGVSNPAAAATPATPASNASIVTYDASGANPATGGVGVIGGEGHSTSAPPGSSQCSDNLVGCKPDPSEGVPCAGNDTTSCVGGGMRRHRRRSRRRWRHGRFEHRALRLRRHRHDNARSAAAGGRRQWRQRRRGRSRGRSYWRLRERQRVHRVRRNGGGLRLLGPSDDHGAKLARKHGRCGWAHGRGRRGR
jgi:hypothetical protein